MIRNLSRCVSNSGRTRLGHRAQSTAATLPNKVINPDVAGNRWYSEKEGFVWKSGYEPIVVPELTLDEYVWKNVAKWQNKVAIVCGITGRKYTYAKLRDHSAAFAVRLQTKFNLKHGDVVAISLPNIPEYAIAVLGAMEAGLTVTTVNPIYTADEICRQLVISNPKLIITLVEGIDTITAARSQAQLSIPIITIKTKKSQSVPEGTVNFSEMSDPKNLDFGALIRTDRSPDETCILPFSSGTTGLPKGVMLSHNNITANCEMLDGKFPEHRLTLPTTNDFQDIFLSVLPFFHIYGSTAMLASKLALGCKVVTLPKFEPETFLTSLAEHKSTFLYVVPPLLLFLANDPRATVHHLAHVRTIQNGAAPIGEQDVKRLKLKASNLEFLQGYGLTESSPLACMGHKGTTNYATIGWPAPSTEAKIVQVDDPSWTGLDANESGELLIRSASVMKGYLDNQEATDQTLVGDGWLRTGDIATYDADGFFYLHDRLKELIKVKGYQVAPAELEAILREHPDVLDAAVVGVKHTKHGEAPRAFVVIKKGSDVSENDLQEHVSERVSEYKQLIGGVQFIDTIPRNATGKILRRALK